MPEATETGKIMQLDASYLAVDYASSRIIGRLEDGTLIEIRVRNRGDIIVELEDSKLAFLSEVYQDFEGGIPSEAYLEAKFSEMRRADERA